MLELLAAGELSSGAICEVIRDEFGISQPAVSAQLRVLREAGFATVRADGTRRLYAVAPERGVLHRCAPARLRSFTPRAGPRTPRPSRREARPAGRRRTRPRCR
ncbi:MAG TPA: ArsR family transcriptional regulator [Solirubrobacteraceae bacterium]